jgi:hypothetical protein
MGIGAALNAGRSTTSHGSIASAMGSLNASHASLNAMSHPAQVAARNAAITAARADVLGPAANKDLTPSVVSAVDKQLGLPATDPTLGVSQSSRY